MTIKWEKVHIFISSTFDDMHAERDYLVKQVFPELREWCERRKLNLVDIDLRWGVREEDTQSKTVIEVCLNSIDKARPFFLCFLGQRRGWVPKSGEISPSTLKSEAFPDLTDAVGNASVTEMEILHALVNPFHRNRITKDHPPEFYQPVKYAFFYLRDPSYLQKFPDILYDVYTNSGVRNDEDNKDENKSLEADRELSRWITEEIPDLCKENHRPDPRVYTAEWNSEAFTPELLLPLKCPSEMESSVKQWRRKWAEAGINITGTSITDPCQIIAAEAYNQKRACGRLNNFQTRGTDLQLIILEDIKAAISERYPDHVEIENQTDLQKEIDQQEQFLHNSGEGFISRGDDFAELYAYVSGSERKLFVLTSPAGAGKSTLLAKWIETYSIQNENQPNQSIHFRFIGQSDRSTTIYSLLFLLLSEIKEVSRKFSDEIPDDPQKLRLELMKLLETAAIKGKTIIVLDALNQLESGLSDLSWLPYQLPENIKMVVSFKRGEPAAEELFKQIQGQVILSEVKPFSDMDDRKKLVMAYLAQYLKDLDDRHLETLIHSSGANNPLFLKVVLSELRVFGAFANLAEKIHTDFGVTPITAFKGVLKRLENDPAYSPIDPKQAVPFLFGLLSYAKQGLSLEEMTDLFVEQFKIMPQKAQDTINLYLRQVRSFIAHRDGCYDFFFESFKLAAQEFCTGEGLPTRSKKIWHKILADYFYSKPLRTHNGYEEILYKAKLFEQPYQLLQAEEWNSLYTTLTDFYFLEAKCRLFPVYDVETDLQNALNNWNGNSDNKEIIATLIDALRIESQHIQQFPKLLFTQIYNHSMKSVNSDDPLRILLEQKSKNRKNWLREVQLKSDDESEADNPFKPHTGAITSLKISPDGLTALSGSADKTIKYWNLQSGQLIRTISGHSSRIGYLEFSPDGKTFLSHASEDENISVWDIQTGQLIRLLKMEGSVYSFTFDQSGKTILGISLFQICQWNSTTGQLVDSTKSDATGQCYNAIISPDKKIAVGKNTEAFQKGEPLVTWDLQTGKIRHSLEGNKDRISSLFFSLDGKKIISRSADSNIRIWDVDSGELINSYFVNTGSISESACLSLDGKTLFCTKNKSLEKYDFQTGEFLSSSDEPIAENGTNVIVISQSGNIILTGGAKNYIKVWDLQTNKFLRYLGNEKNAKGTVYISPDEKIALESWHPDNSIRVWNLENYQLQQHLIGHTDSVISIIVSPDKATVLSGSIDQSIKHWKLETGDLLRSFHGHVSSVNSIVFSPDGKTFLSGSGDKTVKYWDLKSGKLLHTFEGHTGPVYQIAISPDGKTALSGSSDKTLKYWDLSRKRLIRTMEDHSDYILSLAYCNKGKYALTGSKDKTIKLWDLQNGRLLHTFEGLSSPTHLLYVPPSKNIFISNSWDGSLIVWDLDNYELIHSIKAHNSNSITYSIADETVLSGSFSNDSISKWNIKTGQSTIIIPLSSYQKALSLKQNQHSLKGNGSHISSIGISTDNKFMLPGAIGSKLDLWNLSTKKYVRTFEFSKYAFNSLSMSLDGNLAIGTSFDNITQLWEVSSGKILHTFEKECKVICPIVVSNDGKTFFTTSWGNIILKCDIPSKRIIQSCEGHTRPINSFQLSPDNKLLISASSDMTIQLWNSDTLKFIRSFEGHQGAVNSIIFSMDGNRIVSGADDNSIKIWELETGNILHSLEGHAGPINTLALSLDGTKIISGSNDNSIKVFGMESGKLINSYEGHSGSILTLVISADTKTIVSGSIDKTIKLWELDTGKLIRSIDGHKGSINSVCLSPDNKVIISSSEDKTIKLWGFETGKELNSFSTSSTSQHSFHSIALIDSGKTILCSNSNFEIRTREIQTGQENYSWIYSKAKQSKASISQNAQLLITQGSDNSLNLWDTRTGNLIRSFFGHTKWIYDWTFTLDGSKVISYSYDKTIKFWDVNTGKLLYVIENIGINEDCLKIIPSPNRKTITFGSRGRLTMIIDQNTFEILDSIEGELLCVSPNGKLLINILNNSSILIDENPSKPYNINCDLLYKPTILTDSWFAFGYKNNVIIKSNLKENHTEIFFVNDASIDVLKLTSDENWLICGDRKGNVRIFEWIK